MNINEQNSKNGENKNINENEEKQKEEKNVNNSIPQNLLNVNQINMQNIDVENEEMDEIDNLGVKGNINNNYNSALKQRLDSCDSPIPNAQFKFSIDLPNVPKQRLHEYLNDDLLNALDVSPNIPNISSGIINNKNMQAENIDNNPNNLFGFSLYPESSENNIDNQNNNNNLQEFNNNQNEINKNIDNKKIIKDNNINEINKNVYNNNISNSNNSNNVINNNYNNFQNFNFVNNINNINYQNIPKNTNLNYNINNPQIYIPTKLRNKDQINMINSKEINTLKKQEEQNNAKNKFDNGNKKNNQNQNTKKEGGKNKKHFEVRAGDWTCGKCNNLNFSFRNKCNRCGLPKEMSSKYEPMNPEMFGQNMNFPLINGMNANFMYRNNINNININVNNINNPNEVKFYPK